MNGPEREWPKERQKSGNNKNKFYESHRIAAPSQVIIMEWGRKARAHTQHTVRSLTVQHITSTH